MRHDEIRGDGAILIAAAIAGLVGMAIFETAARGDLGVAIACVIALGIAWRLMSEASRPTRPKLEPIRVRAHCAESCHRIQRRD